MDDRVIHQFKDFIIPAVPSILYERKCNSIPSSHKKKSITVGELSVSFAAFIEYKPTAQQSKRCK
jgi:hypothetical protein